MIGCVPGGVAKPDSQQDDSSSPDISSFTIPPSPDKPASGEDPFANGFYFSLPWENGRTGWLTAGGHKWLGQDNPGIGTALPDETIRPALDFGPPRERGSNVDPSLFWVNASASGTVTQASEGLIEIDHGNGLTSIYRHEQNVKVHVGDPVQRGQIIASFGSVDTEYPHLHFEAESNGDPLSAEILVFEGGLRPRNDEGNYDGWLLGSNNITITALNGLQCDLINISSADCDGRTNAVQNGVEPREIEVSETSPTMQPREGEITYLEIRGDEFEEAWRRGYNALLDFLETPQRYENTEPTDDGTLISAARFSADYSALAPYQDYVITESIRRLDELGEWGEPFPEPWLIELSSVAIREENGEKVLYLYRAETRIHGFRFDHVNSGDRDDGSEIDYFSGHSESQEYRGTNLRIAHFRGNEDIEKLLEEAEKIDLPDFAPTEFTSFQGMDVIFDYGDWSFDAPGGLADFYTFAGINFPTDATSDGSQWETVQYYYYDNRTDILTNEGCKATPGCVPQERSSL